ARLTAVRLKDGRVLLVGGRDRSGSALATAELFDPTSSAYSPVGSMTSPRLDPTATVLGDGRVLVAGGEDNTPAPQVSA
ncbi:MAG: kelch repeat-containing protein, partial [Verrucomicrobiota bacterium]